MNYELTIKDFEFDDTVKHFFKTKIRDLLDVSPSDAGAHSKITKTKSGYLGVLEIMSTQGKFVVESAEQDLEKMIKSLFNLMHRHLQEWRNIRFL